MTTNIVDAVSAKMKDTYSTDAFFGYVNWYSIKENNVNVTLDEFNKVCEQEGLKSRVRGPRIVDVFKRAAKSAEGRYYPSVQDNIDLGYGPAVHHIQYLMRSAGSDADSVYRILVRESVDHNDHTIDHTPVAKLAYRRAGNMIIGWETSHVIDHERNLIQEVIRYFSEESQTLTTNAVRGFITNALQRDQLAVLIRSTGGVYFVRSQFIEQLDALDRVVKRVGGEFHSLPLVDDGRQREMIRVAFEIEAKQDMDSLLVEMVEVSKGGKSISRDRWMQFNSDYEHHRRKVREFSDVLDSSLSNSASWLENLKDQLDALLDNIKSS